MTIDQLFSNIIPALELELQEFETPTPTQHLFFDWRGVGQFGETSVYAAKLKQPVTIAAGTPVNACYYYCGGGGRGSRCPATVVAQKGGETYFAVVTTSQPLGNLAGLEIEPGLPLIRLIEGLTGFQRRRAVANPDLVAQVFRSVNSIAAAVPATEADSIPSFDVIVQAALNTPPCFVWAPAGTDQMGFVAEYVRKSRARGETVLVLASRGEEAAEAMRSFAAGVGPSTSGDTEAIYAGVPAIEDLSELNDFSADAAVRRTHLELFTALDEVEASLRDYSNAQPGSEAATKHVELEVEHRRLIYRLHDLRREATRQAQVVLATLGDALFRDVIHERAYDAVVVLEAHAAILPLVAFAACLARKRGLVVGDFRQSPIVVRSRSDMVKDWLKPDVFTFAGIAGKVDRCENDPRLLTLHTSANTTHPAIAQVVGEVAYPGRPTNCEIPSGRPAEIAALSPEAGSSMVFYDFSDLMPQTCVATGGSRSNVISAIISATIAQTLSAHPGVTTILATAYTDQSRLHRSLIRTMKLETTVTATTLHQCSLPQTDCVVFDLVESSTVSSIGFPLKGNVRSDTLKHLTAAITAGRGKFILLGDPVFLDSTLPQDAVLRHYLDAMRRNNVPFKKFPPDLLPALQKPEVKGITYEFDPIKAWDAIYCDLSRAQNRVVWNWPFANAPEVFAGVQSPPLFPAGAALQRALLSLPNDQVMRVLTGQQIRLTACMHLEAGVVIDDDIFWLVGMPGDNGRARPFVRVKGRPAALPLSDLFGMNEIIKPNKSRPWMKKATKPA